MKRIGILTSGGDAPGMNAAVRAAIRCGIDRGMEVYGIERGYDGLLDGHMRLMQWTDGGDILHKGGTILKTARCERFLEDKWQQHAVKMLETFGIEGLIVCGGDGTARGGLELSRRGVKVMAIPGTIDNDLGYSDYTIGFDTAVNTVLSLISNIRDTSSAHERTTIIEVMGRHCGDLAMHAGLAGGADVILVPEVKSDIKEVCRKVLRGQSSGKCHSLIVMAEGVDMNPEELAKTLEEMTGREARAVVPGYIQRGGSPTQRDRLLATLTADKAVELLYGDSDSKAIGMRGDEVVVTDLETALNLPNEFNKKLYDLTDLLAGK